MSWSIFRKHPKGFLGIDIGTFSIRVVELGKKGKSLELENYGEVKTLSIKKRPFRVFEKNTLLLSTNEIAKAIQSINLEAGIKTKEVNFSIPDFCSFFTTIKLPPMSREEIPQAVRYAVRPYIPLPPSEITLDWRIAEGEASKTPLKILVVAIPNDVINQYKTITELSNLTVRFLEPEVFALARSSIKPPAFPKKGGGKDKTKEKIIGLIDIGARSTTCSIAEKGVLEISHSFNIGGNDLTEAIAKSLNIGYNKAEAIKRKYGLSQSNNFAKGKIPAERDLTGLVFKKEKDVRRILAPLVDLILEEIKKTFRDFYQVEGEEIEKIILAGGTVLLPGLKEYFLAGLKKEVIITEPFSDILYPAILKQTLAKLGPSYAISVGLALKGFE